MSRRFAPTSLLGGGGRTPKKMAKRRARPSLLILHLDAEKLRGDGLHFQPQIAFASHLAEHGVEAEVAVVEVTTLASLEGGLAALAAEHRTFDVVLAIGHANAEEIAVASGTVLRWEDFAVLLQPFRPRRLVLVACEGGRWAAALALFSRLPTLRRIFACPVKAYADLGRLLVALTPFVVAMKAPRGNEILFAQFVLLGLVGGSLRHWNRSTDINDPEGLAHDALSDLIDRFAGSSVRALRQLARAQAKSPAAPQVGVRENPTSRE